MKELDFVNGVPPSDTKAEQGVIGSIFLDGKRIEEVEGLLVPDDFYDPRHVGLWHTFLAMNRERLPIDAITLWNRLNEKHRLDEIGGASYLAELAHAVPVAAHILDYARLVKEKAKKRALWRLGLKAAQAAYDGTEDSRALCSDFQSGLNRIEAGGLDRNASEILPFAHQSMSMIERIGAGEQGLGTPVGMWKFDTTFGGLYPCELVILAARTGVGKTSLAMQWAYHIGLKGLVYFVTLEMSGQQLTQRMLCTLSEVNNQHIRCGNVTEEEKARLRRGANRLCETKWVIDSTPYTTVLDIRRACTAKKKDGLRLVVVDYLQIMTPLDHRESRHEQIGKMSWGLKRLAEELEVPVLCVAQLSRKTEEDFRPRLSHLRESGAIEQDADVVIFLHRDSDETKPKRTRREPQQLWGDTSLIVEKNRNACVGTIRLQFVPEFTMYLDEPQPTNDFADYSGDDMEEP